MVVRSNALVRSRGERMRSRVRNSALAIFSDDIRKDDLVRVRNSIKWSTPNAVQHGEKNLKINEYCQSIYIYTCLKANKRKEIRQYSYLKKK